MAEYFDTENTDHTNRLHPDVQDHAQLGQVADRTERDVLRRLSKMRRTNYRHDGNTALASDEDIFETTGASGLLAIGYPFDPDADQAPTGQELEALLDVIADVVSHRLLYIDEDGEATSVSHGGVTKNRGRWDKQWPQGWRKPLEPWRQTAYGT